MDKLWRELSCGILESMKMVTRKFAVVRGEPERLEVVSEGGTPIKVSYDGAIIADPVPKEQLENGWTAMLPENRSLVITKKARAASTITVNGQHVPGSNGDPDVAVKGAGGVLAFVAGASIVAAIVARFWEPLAPFRDGWMDGAIFGVLAFFVLRYASLAALTVGAVLYVVEVVYQVMDSGGKPGGLGARVFFIIFLFRGVIAGFKARQERQARATPGMTPPA